MNFLKMHGIGNDFVILDQRSGRKPLAEKDIRHICDRHTGIGCDQLILMEPSNEADLFMRIYNGDGSESGACGNATRCVADLYMSEQATDACVIETRAGLLPCRRAGPLTVTVDMGAPEFPEKPFIEIIDGLKDPVLVNMGNPHCVFFVEDLAQIDIPAIGPQIEHHPFFPNRTNVEFVQILGRGKVRLRTWERGAGLTLACGSAACATVAAAVQRKLTDRTITIQLDGGELQMEYRETDDHVLMTGPVAYVFDGTLKNL